LEVDRLPRDTELNHARDFVKGKSFSKRIIPQNAFPRRGAHATRLLVSVPSPKRTFPYLRCFSSKSSSLFQRRNFFQRFQLNRCAPQFSQFVPVLIGPKLNQSQSGGRNIAVDDSTRFDFYERFVLAVDRVEMRRRMIARIHSNDDALETADLRHAWVQPPI
jgi:hypothetical protein